ncbi:hypothetical protein ACIQNU_17925 [Streptomyces sp. NPDC091292]|uniref:hypothetical protein n=1 Tax=Streptomyces sp. NPDC091292 TaxID=3365991 RepID=UPI0037FF5369
MNTTTGTPLNVTSSGRKPTTVTYPQVRQALSRPPSYAPSDFMAGPYLEEVTPAGRENVDGVGTS